MNRYLSFFISAFLLFFAAVIIQESNAAIYKYSDKDGMIYFADDLQSVPEQYRGVAKIVSGDVEEEKKPAPAKQEQPRSEAKEGSVAQSPIHERVLAEERGEKQSFSRKIIISIIVVLTAVFSFVILGIVDADHRKAIKIVRVVIVWGVSVYLLYAHAMDVVNIISMMGNKIEAVQQESAEKGRKTAEKIKKFNTMMDEFGKAASEDPSGSEPERK